MFFLLVHHLNIVLYVHTWMDHIYISVSRPIRIPILLHTLTVYICGDDRQTKSTLALVKQNIYTHYRKRSTDHLLTYISLKCKSRDFQKGEP